MRLPAGRVVHSGQRRGRGRGRWTAGATLVEGGQERSVAGWGEPEGPGARGRRGATCPGSLGDGAPGGAAGRGRSGGGAPSALLSRPAFRLGTQTGSEGPPPSGRASRAPRAGNPQDVKISFKPRPLSESLFWYNPPRAAFWSQEASVL